MANKEKKLFTPGPLGVSKNVKEAMLRDLGSRDEEFINIVKTIRKTLLQIAGASPEEYASVLLQGSGTYAVEAALQMVAPRNNQVILIVSNGAYGKRMKMICDTANIPAEVLTFPEDASFDADKVVQHVLRGNYCAVAAVHLETSSGVLNPSFKLYELLVSKLGKKRPLLVLDAMSSFGGVPMKLSGAATPDVLVTSANKCLQGVPGCSILIVRKSVLSTCRGNCRSLSLDVCAQLEGMETNGQFRFTPPTHTLLALDTALRELNDEGGVPARAQRYFENYEVLQQGMRKLGFHTLVQGSDEQSYIITSYLCPVHPYFNFSEFYEGLSNKGQLIYPGKVTDADCFRIGNIGELFPRDMRYLVSCIEAVLQEMGVPIPVPYI